MGEEEAQDRVMVWPEITAVMVVGVAAGVGRHTVVLEITMYVSEFVDMIMHGTVVVVPDTMTVVSLIL